MNVPRSGRETATYAQGQFMDALERLNEGVENTHIHIHTCMCGIKNLGNH